CHAGSERMLGPDKPLGESKTIAWHVLRQMRQEGRRVAADGGAVAIVFAARENVCGSRRRQLPGNERRWYEPIKLIALLFRLGQLTAERLERRARFCVNRFNEVVAQLLLLALTALRRLNLNDGLESLGQ